MGVAKFQEDPSKPGSLVALNDEASAVLAKTERTRAEVERDVYVESPREIREAHVRSDDAGRSPGWVKVTHEQTEKENQFESFRRMGFSEAEARIASGLDTSSNVSEADQKFVDLVVRKH